MVFTKSIYLKLKSIPDFDKVKVNALYVTYFYHFKSRLFFDLGYAYE
jgi:hypothetical protein